MSGNRLKLTSLRGTPRECGEEYGRLFEQHLMGFCHQALQPNKRRLAYAKRCWPLVVRDAPTSADFMKGLAAGSHLSIEHIALIALHEEIWHQPHCSGFAASGTACRGHKTIVAMNWDWSSSLYGWPGLLRLRLKNRPATVTYHYPGLWSAAGINEYGLALMWTSSGIWPQVRSRTGLPTYVLIAEILGLESVRDAVRYLRNSRLAGPFNLLLGDAGGDHAVVEAVPGHLSVDRRADALVRANHYVSDDMVRRTSQRLGPKHQSMVRYRRMSELVCKHHGRISAGVAKEILTDRRGRWPWIHQYPAGADSVSLNMMTLDSLIAVSQDRVLHTCRGGRSRGPWQAVAV